MTDVNVISTTQKIYVDPASSSVSVTNAGPIGPQGPAGSAGGVFDPDPQELADIIESLTVITNMTNANINAKRAAVIKDLARACKAIALILSGETEP